MTEDEIKEGQKLILEFIGYKFDGKFWIKGVRRFSDISIINDWSHLMQIVDYICNEEFVADFEICNSYINIVGAIEVDRPIIDILIDHSGGNDKKRAIFEACVKFIKQIK